MGARAGPPGAVRGLATHARAAPAAHGRGRGDPRLAVAGRMRGARARAGIGGQRSRCLLPTVREEIETILALNPQSARGRALAGNVLMEVPGFVGGDRTRAEKQFRWGIEADPHFTGLRVDLARLLIAGGRDDEA